MRDLTYRVTLQPAPEGEDGALLVLPDEVTDQCKFKDGQLVELSIQDRFCEGYFVERVIAIRKVRQ